MLTSSNSRDVIKQFLLILIPLLVLLFITAAVHYYTNLHLSKVNREADETLNIDLARVMIEGEMRSVTSDLMFLSQLNELQAILQSPGHDQRNKLEYELLAFSRAKGLYDQIRYLDKKGNEIVRINYQNGNPYVVAKTHLQNKEKRYYFSKTLA